MKKEKLISLILAFAGVMLVGTGVAFNAAAALGNDPVGIVYDGIRNAARLSPEQLGIASNIVNVALIIIVFFTGRHYVNIGTFIYVIPYGLAVDFGGRLYHMLFQTHALPLQILGATLGCLLLYTGVAMFITADIGLDPFTGIVMVIKDRLKKEFKYVKVGFDIGCILLGFSLGGKIGAITVITALMAGPLIQLLSDILKKLVKGDKK